jgi:Trypsin-co-occurring domain 2
VIELAQMIQDLRAELHEALAAGLGQELRFELGPIELDMAVMVSREASGGGKVRFWVVEADGAAKLAHASTQRIKLKLEPKLASTGRRPEVFGDRGDRER